MREVYKIKDLQITKEEKIISDALDQYKQVLAKALREGVRKCESVSDVYKLVDELFGKER